MRLNLRRKRRRRRRSEMTACNDDVHSALASTTPTIKVISGTKPARPPPAQVKVDVGNVVNVKGATHSTDWV